VQERRKHSIIGLFLLFWFLPDMISYTSLELNEIVVDGSIRICLMLMVLEFYKSINFTRIYLKAAAWFCLIACVFGSFDYILTFLLIDNSYLNVISTITKIVGYFIGVVGLIQLTFSYHYKGMRFTWSTLPKMVVARWRA
jgi:hypothetical protein